MTGKPNKAARARELIDALGHEPTDEDFRDIALRIGRLPSFVKRAHACRTRADAPPTELTVAVKLWVTEDDRRWLSRESNMTGESVSALVRRLISAAKAEAKERAA